MKKILAPLALALFAAEARADHRDGFFLNLGPCGVSIGYRSGGFAGSLLSCRPVGRYEWRERKVWCPGSFETVRVEPRYEFRVVGCIGVKVCVRPGYFRKVWHEGFWKCERYQVWVTGPGICD